MNKVILYITLALVLAIFVIEMTYQKSTEFYPKLKGELLYEHYCTECHSSNLKQPGTGPALGNITMYRSQGYLRDVTKNFLTEADGTNEIAKCLLDSYGGLAMTSFEYLTMDEIDSIYSFIEIESKLQNIAIDEIKLVTSCKEENDKVYYSDQFGNLITQQKYDTTKIKKQHIKRKFNQFYFKNLKQFYYHKIESNVMTVDRFKVETTIPENKLIKAYLIYNDIDLVQPLNYYKGNYYIIIPPYYTKNIEVKKSKTFKILIIEESIDDNILYGIKTISRLELNKTHRITINKGRKNEIRQLIEL